jgi:hypothetical protein
MRNESLSIHTVCKFIKTHHNAKKIKHILSMKVAKIKIKIKLK